MLPFMVYTVSGNGSDCATEVLQWYRLLLVGAPPILLKKSHPQNAAKLVAKVVSIESRYY